MGDRYELTIKCPKCDTINKEVWYAPTCGSDTFNCRKCKKEFFITSNFRPKRLKDVELKDVIEGFDMTTVMARTDEEIKKICKEHLKELKEGCNDN